ncbi:HAD family phosphatase [Saccharobesus litoralis]|uniref:HAD family phosphatase n=1 Tax=Saccharobesus litoralis TaxID=2172099 RepID=A0A2S0VP93_9ALTE|nr:HAD family phosphatase [Saccharobesus litoralis]AWB66024.1 HAD family phosphatase [Saccharobesus litoralis]
MTLPFKAILFDKDGTIFDSEAMFCQSWVESAKEFNVHFTAEMYDQFVGVRADECYRRAVDIFGKDFPMDEFKVYNRKWINDQKAIGVPFKLGFQAFFEKVLASKLPLGLVTSSTAEATRLSFGPYPEYLPHFQVQITGDKVAKPKPDPMGYLMACQALNVEPSQALVFEDSTAGITAGLEAGCQVVAIPDYLPIAQPLLDRCAYVLESFEQADFLLNT